MTVTAAAAVDLAVVVAAAFAVVEVEVVRGDENPYFGDDGGDDGGRYTHALADSVGEDAEARIHR